MKHFCTLVDELLAEKGRINPIPEGTTALIFTPAGADGQEVTITDPKVISALRSAYCWTNQHLHCCLPGEVEATMSVVVRGARRSEEPARIYADTDVLSNNYAFRHRLYDLWQDASTP